MADVYANSVASAKRLIAKFGRDMTLKTIARSGDKWNPTLTPTTTTVTGAVIEYKTHQIDGMFVKVGDKMILFDSTVNITIGDKIIDGDNTYSIVDFNTIAPGSSVILYKVQVRR